MPNSKSHGGKDRPVLWAYPGTYFDYAGQNRFGGDASVIGPSRIITDRNKNIQGMVTHPYNSRTKFVRVPEGVRYYDRR